MRIGGVEALWDAAVAFASATCKANDCLAVCMRLTLTDKNTTFFFLKKNDLKNEHAIRTNNLQVKKKRGGLRGFTR